MIGVAKDTINPATMDHEHLLKTSEADEGERAAAEEYVRKNTFQSGQSRMNWSLVTIHGVLLSLYSLVTLAIIWNLTRKEHSSPPRCSEVFPAVDDLEIEFQKSNTEVYEMSGYHGTPNAEMDRLWEDLIRSRFIAVSHDELERSGRTSIAIKPEGPYLAWLGIFHELHCLVSVCQVFNFTTQV